MSAGSAPPMLGWRYDLERREELHGTACVFSPPKTFSAPDEIMHEWIEVEFQAAMGSCSGQSMSTIQEVLNYIATGEVVQLSRMFAYLAGQEKDNLIGQDVGASITGSVRGAKELGNCLETTFPYPSRYTTKFPAGSKEEAKQHVIRSHSVLKNYSDCFNWLATGVGAFQIGITWTTGCDACTGIFDENTQRGTVRGGHALAVVGFSKKKDAQGRNYLALVNSHGKGWGTGGRALVAPVMFDKWGRDPRNELIGVTDLVPIGGTGEFGIRDFKIRY